MLRRVLNGLAFCGLAFAILIVHHAIAQVPSGVLRKKNDAPKKPEPNPSDSSPKPLMYFDPDDPSKFPELVHRMEYKFRARHLPIVIGGSPSPSSIPDSPINWR